MSGNPRMEFYDLEVAKVIRETADTSSYAFRVPADLEELFRYQAGQFFTFEVPWGGMRLVRSYSLASSPDERGLPVVAVKRVDGGRVSNWFNDEVGEGMVLRVQPPAGRFVLRPGSTAPLLLLAGGSGITPMMSLMKTALLTTARPVRLFYANRDENSVIFLRELVRLQARYGPRLEVIHHLDCESGFVTEPLLRDRLPVDAQAECYICGPGPFMDVVEQALADRGVPRAQIHVERFISPVDPDRKADAPPVDVPETGAAQVIMRIGGAEHHFAVEPNEPILAAALRQGVEAEYQCEEGYCGCCMARLKAGQVVMPSHEALSDAEVDEGWILTCQARCSTPKVEVDYDAGF